MPTYTVTITRTYGDVAAAITLESEFSNAGDFLERTLGASELIHQSHEEFASKVLPTMGASSASQTQPQTSTQTATVELAQITRKVDRGATMIRCHGGRWQKWGIPVYEEVINQSPLLLSFLENQELAASPVGYEMDVDIVDGKPKRVSAIRKTR